MSAPNPTNLQSPNITLTFTMPQSPHPSSFAFPPSSTSAQLPPSTSTSPHPSSFSFRPSSSSSFPPSSSSSSAQRPPAASSTPPPPPPAASTPPPLPSSDPSSSRVPEYLMHKNRLQEFAQRSNMPLPVYHTVNEGPGHAPRFRATVWVDGKHYTSQNVFTVRKAAEQDVAKLAYEKIVAEIKDEGLPDIFEKTMFFKSILNEFAAKMNLEKVAYRTVKSEGHPFFVSSLVFNGKSYTGDPARNKKEAEQLAARTAILSNLSDSRLGTRLSEVIKSKFKFCAAISNVKEAQHINTASHIASSGHVSVSAAPGTVSNNENSNKFELARGLQQAFHMSEQGKCPEDSIPSNLSQQAGEVQHTDDGSSLKRKKNKKKANKKPRMDPLPPIAASPLNQAPPSVLSSFPLGQPSCSVAQ